MAFHLLPLRFSHESWETVSTGKRTGLARGRTVNTGNARNWGVTFLNTASILNLGPLLLMVAMLFYPDD